MPPSPSFKQTLAARLVTSVTLIVDAKADDLAAIDASLAWVRAAPFAARWRMCLKFATLTFAVMAHPADAEFDAAADDAMRRWNPESRVAFKDLMGLIDGADLERDGSTLVGTWVLWNTKGSRERPTTEQMAAAPKVGHFCLRTAANWEQIPI